MAVKLLVVVLGVVLVSCGVASCAGVKEAESDTSILFYLTDNGVEKIKDIVNPLAEHALNNLSVPDQHISAVGINLYLTNIQIHDFKFSDTVTLVAPDRVQVSVDSLQCYSTMDWHYHDGPLIDIKGDANDTVKNTKASLGLELGSDGEGHATIKATGCSVDIGDLDIVLHGGDAKFYEAIAKLFKPLLISELEKQISSAVVELINTEAATLIALIPVDLELVPGYLGVHYPLIHPVAEHGLRGTYYHNCIFGSGHEAVLYDAFDIHLKNYKSFDVGGYFQPGLDPSFVAGDYVFQIHGTQRGLLEIAGASIGKLEPHNIGMCWPEVFTHKTGALHFEPDVFYPIRLRYQAGCGGGYIQVHVCDKDGGNCKQLSPLATVTKQEVEFPVVVAPDWIEVSSNSSFYVPKQPGLHCPMPHHTLPELPPSAQPMVYAIVDEFLFNSAGFAVARSGYFDFNITQDMLPPEVPIELNTTYFNQLLPALYEKYPDDQMLVRVFLDEDGGTYPEVHVGADGLNASIAVFCNVSVADSTAGGKVVPVFELRADVAAAGAVDLRELNITGKLVLLNAELSVAWSDLPDFNVSGLDPLVQFAVEGILLPYLNTALETGIPLPIPAGIGIELHNTKISYSADGFVSLAADFDYVGPLPWLRPRPAVSERAHRRVQPIRMVA